MSTLQIIQLESGAFKHVDSIDGDFFLGRFSFKQEFNKAFLVEAYGAKRREYTINQISVFSFGGGAETFTIWTDLFNRLTVLGYNGIDTNGLIPANLETTLNKTTEILGSETSVLKYPNIKAVVDWVTSLFVPKTLTLTIGGVTQDLSENRTFTVSAGEIRQYFFTYGNKYNLSTIGNYYFSEVELGLTPTTINNSPGNNLVGVMSTRWVMPIMYSFRSQKLKKVVFVATDVNFTSFNLVLFMGRRLNGSTTRVDNVVIHNQNYTLTGSGTTSVIEITSFTNDITIPEGYELCALYSRLNGTNGTINNVQLSGYAS